MTLPEEAKIIDKKTYVKGVFQMNPGKQRPLVFVSDGRKKKNPELLCAVISMPEWHEILQRLSALEAENQRLRFARSVSSSKLKQLVKLLEESIQKPDDYVIPF